MMLGSGCSRHSPADSKLKTILSEYIGQELQLPPDSVCNLFDFGYGISTLGVDYLIVSYIKSDGCTPCHLHLPYWKELNTRLDTLSEAVATSVLFIEPDTLDKVADFIRKANYDYPVVIDTTGRFTTMNPLPEPDFLRTFLIDRNGKILALGNPTENEGIRRHIMSIVTGHDEDETPSPLTVNNNKTDIGTVPHSCRREFEFYVNNASTDTVKVNNILTPCECITAKADSILPGGSGAVRIRFDASMTDGAFHHPVVVRYRGISQPVILHIYGYVNDY